MHENPGDKGSTPLPTALEWRPYKILEKSTQKKKIFFFTFFLSPVLTSRQMSHKRTMSQDPLKRAKHATASRLSSAAAARAVPPAIPLGRFRRTTVSRSLSVPERKAVDSSSTMNFDSNSAVANCMQLLNTIATGSASNQRIGKRVTLRAVMVRGRVAAQSATIYEKCVLMLVYIKTPNQAATLPAVNEILVSQSSNALTNRDNASKFRILRRWEWIVTGNSTAPATGQEQHAVEEYVRLPNLPSLWTNASTAGTIGEFVEGALILLSVGINANGATTTPAFTGNQRVYFSDA